jgi:aspartate aminotransferase
MKIARRLGGISASPTVAVMQEAQRLKQQGVDVIDLGPGEPDFPTPAPIKQAGIEAIRSDFTKYTASSGISELREAVAAKLNREWGADFSAANVIITAGAKHAVYSVCMAVFEEGDEVLNPVPYWVTFPETVRIAGATPMDLPTQEAQGFVLDPGAVEAALGPRTRGLIVNTPNNPSGAVIPADGVRRLVEIGRSHGVFLLFDETYEHFTYGESRHVSLASFVKAADDFFAIVGSTSKTYSMTGWRIGYVVASRDLIDKIGEFQSHASGNPASVSQKAALAALKSDPQLVDAMREEYSRRRAYVLEEVARIPGFSCARPEGAFYVFPNVSACLRDTGPRTSQELAAFLLREARVATVPGSAFGLEGYLRLSYATSMENLREALTRVRTAVTRLLAR